MMLLAGCSSSPRYTGKPVPADFHYPEIAAPPSPSANKSYNYRVITADCNCQSYTAKDPDNKLEYRFEANYTMNNGVATNVLIDLTNRSRDTLFLDQATAKVFSKNISYMYNNKFIPLPMLVIPPGSSNSITLNGKDRIDENDWHKIAGEQLTLTLKGLRIGTRELPLREVTFVPENPLIGK
jgi:hypothetical protein